MRLLKIVVAIDSAKTTVNACSRKKLPMNTLLLGQRPNKRNFVRSTKLNKNWHKECHNHKKQKLGHKFNELNEQSITLLNFLTLFIVMI